MAINKQALIAVLVIANANIDLKLKTDPSVIVQLAQDLHPDEENPGEVDVWLSAVAYAHVDQLAIDLAARFIEEEIIGLKEELEVRNA